MNITFFIGNGFDMQIGLKTSYSDFYPEFLKNSPDSNMIKEWLVEDINKYGEENFTNILWSDLEETLGKKLDRVKEDEVEKFIGDKREMDLLLIDYLEEEQNRLKVNGNEKEIAKEFSRSLTGFTSKLTSVGRNSIQQTFNNYKSDAFKYCFICFNYTNILDQIISVTNKEKPQLLNHKYGSRVVNDTLDNALHINGTLNSGMILGVNDADQINNISLKSDSDFLDIFVKKNMNDIIEQNNIEHAKKIINGSHIIIIYGMSVGNTDKMWWIEIVEWLNKSKDNKLIIYVYSSEYLSRRNLPQETIRLYKETKHRILEKGGVQSDDPNYVELADRIFVSYRPDIFKFEGIVS